MKKKLAEQEMAMEKKLAEQEIARKEAEVAEGKKQLAIIKQTEDPFQMLEEWKQTLKPKEKNRLFKEECIEDVMKVDQATLQSGEVYAPSLSLYPAPVCSCPALA